MFAEPYAFTLNDHRGRWTIAARHHDEIVRGKPRRTMVATCSCGWSKPFSVRSYAATGLEHVIGHLRRHQLEALPATYSVERECGGWQQVILTAGRMHCAAPCHLLKPKEFRATSGFGEPCAEHGGALHDRHYHWTEVDPEDHGGDPRPSTNGFIRGAGGMTWHYWCAPIEARAVFGFLRPDQREQAQ